MFFRLTCIAFFPALIAGTPLLQNERIINGVPVDIKDYPYQVSVDIDGQHRCGGVIISESFVVTAAHCLPVWDEYHHFDYTIRVNTSRYEEGGSVHWIKNNYTHPDYVHSKMDYDIAIMELEEPLTFGVGIQPIDLPESGEELENRTRLTISGWGAIYEDDPTPSQQLLAVDVTSYTNEECNDIYASEFDLPVTDRMICGNPTSGMHNDCFGDGGGPVTHDGVLYGLVSWSVGCAREKYPSVYSRVANPSMREFVTQITGI